MALPSTGIPGILKPPTPFFSYGTGELPLVSQSNAVPYVENWSLSVQYQLSNSAMVQASYVGSGSHHLFSAPEPINLMPESTTISEVQSGFNFNSSATTSEYFPTVTGNGNINLLPYPQFYNNPIWSAWIRESAANYNALYVNGVQTLRAGLTVIGSFTWSKSMDDGSSGTEDGIVTDIFGFAYPQTPFSKAGEYSLSTYDIPIHATAAYVWDLPVGKGQLLNTENPILNAIFGGLTTSGIFNAESGYPAWVNLGSDGYFFSTLPVCNGASALNCTPTLTYGSGGAGISAGGAGHDTLGEWNIRPNIMPGVPLILANWRKNALLSATGNGPYLNPAAFSVPGSPGNPQIGDAPRTLGARSPRTIYFDMNGTKDILFHGDRVDLKISADAINIFNHANLFINPNSDHSISGSLNTATGIYTTQSAFGDVSGGASPARTFALGAKVTF